MPPPPQRSHGDSREWTAVGAQDRCTAFSYLEADPELAFFAVYDGHGGTGVANYLKDHLHEFILAQAEYRSAPKSYIILDGCHPGRSRPSWRG
jgi:serine/threonine protein phosphatase PrpC